MPLPWRPAKCLATMLPDVQAKSLDIEPKAVDRLAGRPNRP